MATPVKLENILFDLKLLEAPYSDIGEPKNVALSGISGDNSGIGDNGSGSYSFG